MFFGISLNAQSFKGFLKPVPDNILARNPGHSEWLFRPSVTITAMKYTYIHEEGKPFEVSSFSEIGVGLSYQHFIDNEGALYNNYGFSLLFLFKAVPGETNEPGISLAGTVNVLQYINLGAGFDLTNKKVFLLTGIIYSFN